MNDYMNDLVIIKRLIREWITHNSLIIAYDYDNTVYDYHNVGCDFTVVRKPHSSSVGGM